MVLNNQKQPLAANSQTLTSLRDQKDNSVFRGKIIVNRSYVVRKGKHSASTVILLIPN